MRTNNKLKSLLLIFCFFIIGVFTNIAYGAEYKVIIQINLNGGSLAEEHDERFSEDSEGFIVRKNNNRSIITFTSETVGRVTSCTNPNWINVVGKNGWTLNKESAYNTKADGTGKSYSLTQDYRASDFADISKGDKTVVLYVNWTKRTDRDWKNDKELVLEQISVDTFANYKKTKGTPDLANDIMPWKASQGMAVSDKYILFATSADDEEDNPKSKIVIIDKKTRKILNVDEKYYFGHGNGVSYNKNKDLFYISYKDARDGNYYISSFKINDKHAISNVVKHNVGVSRGSIAYDNDNNTILALRRTC